MPALSPGTSDEVFQLLQCFDLHDLASRLWRVCDGLAGSRIGAGAFFGCGFGMDVDFHETWECEDSWA